MLVEHRLQVEGDGLVLACHFENLRDGSGFPPLSDTYGII
jgi:hypothetical protein